MLKKISVLSLALFLGAASVFAQDMSQQNTAQDAQTRSLTSGQKYKIKGVVVAKDDQSFVVRDMTGVNTRIMSRRTRA
jgi:hypothetical protein